MAQESSAWQRELARAFSRLDDLLAYLAIPPESLPASTQAARQFPLRVPRGFAARMRKGDPQDPLLLQVLPHAAESDPAPGFLVDPVGDRRALIAHGLIQKYARRVLLVATGACAVHCRYCFRRHFPYADSNPSADHWQGALAAIANDPAIEEVILSGGDPLSLSDPRLTDLVDRIAAVPHVQRLRVHTRYPIVLPERINQAVLQWMTQLRLGLVVVIHANHPHELDASVAAAVAALRAAGATVLNQSVLLKGVNDDAEILIALSRRLFEIGVLPYYLHALDRVAGAAHFEVAAATASSLRDALRVALPGYLVPRMVRDQEGVPYKLAL
jgi:EF-P beta-lysylation protein EpmB